MTEDRPRRARRALAIALAFAAAGPAAAGATSLPCLWTELSAADKARLELAARIGEPPAKALYDRIGDAGLAAHFARCGVALEAEPLAVATRYLTVRASAETLFAQLVASGVPAMRAAAALEQAAPSPDRRRLAEDIMALETGSTSGGASAAVRRVARALAEAGPQTTDGAAGRLILAGEWAAAQILADGLEQGAKPPGPR